MTSFGKETSPGWLADSLDTYSYEDMQADIEHLMSMDTDHLLFKDSIGVTYDGREITHIIVGNQNAPKHVLIIGAIHAREYITSQLVMKQVIDIFETLYSDNRNENREYYRSMLNEVAVHFVPMSNPDGVTISQFGLNGIRHKEVRQNIYRIYENDNAVEIAPYLRQWKSNAGGVDLNRNFDARWEEYLTGPDYPSSDHYKGVAPFSERETKALEELTEQYPFVRTISYHTQGKVIYWYFGQKGDFREECERFTELLVNITGYYADANFQALDPAGYKDWAIQKKKIPSVTIEVGKGKNPIPSEQFAVIWEENRDVIPTILSDLCS